MSVNNVSIACNYIFFLQNVLLDLKRKRFLNRLTEEKTKE